MRRPRRIPAPPKTKCCFQRIYPSGIHADDCPIRCAWVAPTGERCRHSRVNHPTTHAYGGTPDGRYYSQSVAAGHRKASLPSKEDFAEYVSLQRSGGTNMLALRGIPSFSAVMDNYAALAAKYPDVVA